MRWLRSLAVLPLLIACGENRPGGNEEIDSAVGGELTNCTIQGAILAKYNALGGAGSFLGACTGNETPTPDGVGRFNHFQNGSIYWTPSTGAFEVHGAIRTKWASLGYERSALGYPLSDEEAEGACRVSRFQSGGIYWCPSTGLFAVQGHIWQRYTGMGGAASPLGAPTADEGPAPAGRQSNFEQGSIYWEASTASTRIDMKTLRSPTLTKAYTEYLGRLTDTAVTPMRNVGIKGTDLGVSFERDGQLVFLFGDSWLVGPNLSRWDDDSVAFAPLAMPRDGSLPKLNWMTDGSGQFKTLGVAGVNTKGMNVPVEGVAVGAKTFLFFSTGWGANNRHTHSVLAHANGLDLGNLVRDHMVPSDKFINISAVRMGDELWLYGSGAYRASAVYLAKVNINTIADRNSWRYFSGFTGTEPRFTAGEQSAVPVVNASCVGEFSVRKHPTLELLLMTYNCGTPRGILLHTAASPTGPWSAPQNIFDPGANADRGYEHFIHASRQVTQYDDGLSEPGRDNEWGGEYAPYLVPQWFSSKGGVHSIIYLLSSWNPYQVHLMRTVLVEPGAVAPRPAPVATGKTELTNAKFESGNFSGWSQDGTPFTLFNGADGKRRVTTFVGAGDAATGHLWQDFTVGPNVSTLSFAAHGGNAGVRLLLGPDIIRETRGGQSNNDTPAVWNISDLRGKTVRLVVADDLTGPWGFVGSTGFELK